MALPLIHDEPSMKIAQPLSASVAPATADIHCDAPYWRASM